jgi:hypothetical protein
MSAQLTKTADAMFPQDGSRETVNVKFFLGNSRTVTAEALADQLDRADAQVRSGVAKRHTTIDSELADI